MGGVGVGTTADVVGADDATAATGGVVDAIGALVDDGVDDGVDGDVDVVVVGGAFAAPVVVGGVDEDAGADAGGVALVRGDVAGVVVEAGGFTVEVVVAVTGGLVVVVAGDVEARDVVPGAVVGGVDEVAGTFGGVDGFAGVDVVALDPGVPARGGLVDDVVGTAAVEPVVAGVRGSVVGSPLDIAGVAVAGVAVTGVAVAGVAVAGLVVAGGGETGREGADDVAVVDDGVVAGTGSNGDGVDAALDDELDPAGVALAGDAVDGVVLVVAAVPDEDPGAAPGARSRKRCPTFSVYGGPMPFHSATSE